MSLKEFLRKKLNPTTEDLNEELQREKVKAEIRTAKAKGKPKNSSGSGLFDYAKGVAENVQSMDLVGDTSTLKPKKNKEEKSPW